MFKILNLAVMVGFLSGILSSSFLHLLNSVTQFRQSHSFLIWGLPFFGLIFSFIIKKVPHHINQGLPYILKEDVNISPWMVPFIFLSSLGTHLFGGSAGREGVGVIMGASAAHILPTFSSSFRSMKKYLIHGGIAAGFSSIFGTPLAAIIFSFELSSLKESKKVDLLLCTTLSSFTAFFVSRYLGPSHQHFVVSIALTELLPYVLICGIASGLGALFFYWGLKAYTKMISYLLPHLAFKMGVGGLFISLLVFFTQSYDYIGIGTDFIGKSFVAEMSYYDFVMKALLTIMTLSIGFKGGEVTPLFFMGATLSNWAASIFSFRNFALSSSLGMVSLFGAVTGTPFASAVMGCELFGWRIGIVCFATCLVARVFMRNHSVYRH